MARLPIDQLLDLGAIPKGTARVPYMQDGRTYSGRLDDLAPTIFRNMPAATSAFPVADPLQGNEPFATIQDQEGRNTTGIDIVRLAAAKRGGLTFDSRAHAEARIPELSVPLGARIYLSSYAGYDQADTPATKGGTGSAVWTRVATQPAHPCYFTTGSGPTTAYWELTADYPSTCMWGARGDPTVNVDQITRDVVAYCRAKKLTQLFVPAGIHLLQGPIPIDFALQIHGVTPGYNQGAYTSDADGRVWKGNLRVSGTWFALPNDYAIINAWDDANHHGIFVFAYDNPAYGLKAQDQRQWAGMSNCGILGNGFSQDGWVVPHSIISGTLANLTTITGGVSGKSARTRLAASWSSGTGGKMGLDQVSGDFLNGETFTFSGGSGRMGVRISACTGKGVVYASESAVPIAGTTVTGGSSGATATVTSVRVDPKTLSLNAVSGTFTDGEAITFSDGKTAIVSSYDPEMSMLPSVGAVCTGVTSGAVATITQIIQDRDDSGEGALLTGALTGAAAFSYFETLVFSDGCTAVSDKTRAQVDYSCILSFGWHQHIEGCRIHTPRGVGINVNLLTRWQQADQTPFVGAPNANFRIWRNYLAGERSYSRAGLLIQGSDGQYGQNTLAGWQTGCNMLGTANQAFNNTYWYNDVGLFVRQSVSNCYWVGELFYDMYGAAVVLSASSIRAASDLLFSGCTMWNNGSNALLPEADRSAVVVAGASTGVLLSGCLVYRSDPARQPRGITFLTATAQIHLGDTQVFGHEPGKDIVTPAGSFVPSTRSAKAYLSGIPALPVYTVADAPNAAENPHGIAKFSNGDAGQACIAVAHSGQWRRIALGPAIAAS